MAKTNKCRECGKEFLITVKINGKTKSLRSRKFCLDCSPYRGDKCKNKICKNCGKSFPLSIKVNGKHKYLSRRSYCLQCIPFKSGEWGDSKYNPLSQPTPRDCRICGKTFIYEKRKGHRRFVCNSCKTVKRDIARKKRAVKYKGEKCVICGYDKYYGALDFHHKKAEEKEFSIGGNYSLAWERLEKELDKCILVCCRCHREIHAGIIKYLNNGIEDGSITKQ